MMLRPKTWLAAMRAAAGYSAPLLPFTSFPAALTVEGQIRRPAELPHVSLISLGGLWRPLGGRQVLASRTLNPVTVQDLTTNGIVAERIGPFPGGLVRAGMQIQSRLAFLDGAIGTGTRVGRLYAGPSGAAVAIGQIAYWQTAVNSIYVEGELYSRIDVLSDGSANHAATPSSASNCLALAGGYQTQGASNTRLNPLVDFSAPWEVAVVMQSAAETPVAITGATWSAGVATYTTSAPHTLAVGDKTVVSGITPAGYNATVVVKGVPDSTHFTADMASDPGVWSAGGQSSRISNMVSQSYVLELVG